MPRPKTAAERGITDEDGVVKVGDLVKFGRFTYRVVEVRKNLVKSMGEDGSVLYTEPECLEVIGGESETQGFQSGT